MTSKSDIVVKTEGAIAFLIPALTVLSTSLAVKGITYTEAVAFLCAALVAGLSGLKSFLSTTFSDANAAASAPPAAPAPAYAELQQKLTDEINKLVNTPPAKPSDLTATPPAK